MCTFYNQIKFRRIVKFCCCCVVIQCLLFLSSACAISDVSTQEKVFADNAPVVGSDILSDKIKLLKLAPGYYNVECNSSGKIVSVIVVVHVKAKRISDPARKQSQLTAWGILGELTNPSVVTSETKDGLEKKTSAKSQGKLSGYSLDTLVVGQDAKKETAIFVYRCKYSKPESMSVSPSENQETSLKPVPTTGESDVSDLD